ncbi:MAG TPA: hypothetical protein VHV56_04980 [Pseudolabrys sp.]|jgi:hypothetical protein|nr:hypothetical protein [Pseudolabrys sp.]
MTTRNHRYIAPVDMHAAIARAHADRAEYIRIALEQGPALLKHFAAKLRSGARASRARLPHISAWA